VKPLSQRPEIAVEQALAAAPHDVAGRDVWLFTYGAMLEDPPFKAIDWQTVACLGWRREFCLSDPELRGTAAHPGLALGLVEGGQCVGVAWRLAAQTVRTDLARVLAAELRLPAYAAAWLPIHAPQGYTTALVLVADAASPLFEPYLAEDEVVKRVAVSSGQAGANAAYLRDAVNGLDRAGVADLYLNRLWARVRSPLRRRVEANGPPRRR